MKIFLTGGTGFVGSALVLRLLRDRHSVSVWTRRPDIAPALLGGDVAVIDANRGENALREAMDGTDAVINLAGETVVSRWSGERKRKLRASRIDTTRELVRAMKACSRTPRVLVSASAIGFYGSSIEKNFDERDPPASDFLATLCRDWEKEAMNASELAIRVCVLRLGIVLGAGGGALASMIPVFSIGAGGRLGSGRQWMSWIHIDDLVEIIARALDDPAYSGPVNAVAPAPVTNREFTRELATLLGRPAIFPVPSLALRTLYGEGAQALIASQRVNNQGLRKLAFSYQHPTLRGALQAATHHDPTVAISSSDDDAPDTSYLRDRGSAYLLTQETPIERPRAEVFPFFSKAENLGVLTPPDMEFRILTPSPIAMEAGREIDYRIRLGVIPMIWKTVIERWEPGAGFVDAQHRGPYRAWYHEHEFREDGSNTLMVDRVWYTPPFGILGRIAHRLFIASMLRRIFEYRATRVRLRFGAGRSHASNDASRLTVIESRRASQ